MTINGDSMVDVFQAVWSALDGALPDNWHVHPPVPQEPPAPPCVIVGVPTAVEEADRTICTEPGPWAAWEVPVLCIAADTTGRDLFHLVDATRQALEGAGMRSTPTETRTYQPPDRPAGLPAVQITAS